MPSGTVLERVVRGACCRTIFRHGRRCTIRWASTGVMKLVYDELREQARMLEGRSTEPTTSILDSQSVKGSAQGGSHGYDAGKKVKGRKRHILVDVLGLIISIVISPASVQDRDGAVPVIEQAMLEHSNIRRSGPTDRIQVR